MNRTSLFLFAASAFVFLAGVVFLVFSMEMYDLKPGFWGPQGVEFEEWLRVWTTSRDLYMWMMAGSFLSVLGLIIAGAALMDRQRPLTTH
jgi:hypothetical protein